MNTKLQLFWEYNARLVTHAICFPFCSHASPQRPSIRCTTRRRATRSARPTSSRGSASTRATIRTYQGGVPPGYAGHVHGSRYMVGQSVYATADTYGHPDSQGATAKQFSSQVDAKGANYDQLSSIYGNGFVADGLADDPRDAFVKQGQQADWVLTDDKISNKKF